jgi:hypothetical protein
MSTMRLWSALEELAFVQHLGWPKLDSIPLVYPSSFLPGVILSPLRVVSMLPLESGCRI